MFNQDTMWPLKNKYTLYCWVVFLCLTGLGSCGQATRETSATGSSPMENDSKGNVYTNPVLDRNFPDPAVIKAPDGYYYAYGTNTAIDGEVANIQVTRSVDLVHWEFAGDALPEKPSWAGKDFWAPHVLYDTTNQTYYLYYSGESSNEKGKCLGVATSKSPSGPFKDKGAPLLCGDGFVNIDPMAFDDPATGKKLLYWGSGHEAIKARELAGDRVRFKEGSEVIELVQPIFDEDPANYQKLVEGAWVVYRNGYYYMFYSGDNCCGEEAHYAVMAARSKNATGPFETYGEATGSKNSVILARNERWIAPGHNSIITDAAGEDWILYHAIDPDDRSKGRVMLMDKVVYRNGWPQIEGGTPSENKVRAPVVE